LNNLNYGLNGTALRRPDADRPIIAVDVDGVLNRFDDYQPVTDGNRSWWRRAPRADGWTDVLAGADSRAGGGIWVRVNPQHGPALVALAEATGAELVWCTMWEEDAKYDIAPIVGLPDMPYVPVSPARRAFLMGSSRRPTIGEQKALALALYARGRPVIWFDDELDAADALADFYDGDQLVVTVNPAKGLTRENFAAAHLWLDALAARRGIQPVLPLEWPAAPETVDAEVAAFRAGLFLPEDERLATPAEIEAARGRPFVTVAPQASGKWTVTEGWVAA